jgi:hypothetical protein
MGSLYLCTSRSHLPLRLHVHGGMHATPLQVCAATLALADSSTGPVGGDQMQGVAAVSCALVSPPSSSAWDADASRALGAYPCANVPTVVVFGHCLLNQRDKLKKHER